MNFTSLPFAEQLHPKVVGGVVALVAVGITAAYIYFCKPKGCLDPKKFKEFKLVKRTELSHDSARFRFALPTPKSVLGIPVGKHILCRGKDSKGEQVERPYMPITLDSDLGYFELVVKMYPQGRMSHHFRQMREGDYLAAKGPEDTFSYKPGQAPAIGMLAGGVGITPMFRLIRAVLENPKDKTKLSLIYANDTLEDILLKEELDLFASKYPDRFKVYYVLNQVACSIQTAFHQPDTSMQKILPPESWTGGVGFISEEMIQTHCPAPAKDIKILRCGPPDMNKAMAIHLNALGYTPEMQIEI